MNPDIRLSTDFYHNRKTKKLIKRLGDSAIVCLQRLWISAANNKPSGKLAGWDEEDIELEAEFGGEDGLFVSTLLEIGFLDKDEEYSLHNWKERQGWVAKSSQRSDKARLSRMAKTHNRIYKELIAEGYNGISKEEYEKLTVPRVLGNDNQRVVNETLDNLTPPLTPAPAPAPAPSPSPSPSPSPTTVKEKKVTETEKEKTASEKKEVGQKDYSEAFKEFWVAYPKQARQGKAIAWKKWKLLKLDPIVTQILSSLDAFKMSSQWVRDNGQFIPHASTWINQARWEDDPAPAAECPDDQEMIKPKNIREAKMMQDDAVAKMLLNRKRGLQNGTTKQQDNTGRSDGDYILMEPSIQ